MSFQIVRRLRVGLGPHVPVRGRDRVVQVMQVVPDGASAVAEDDAAPVEVIRRELHHHAVLGKDPDVVLAHLA